MVLGLQVLKLYCFEGLIGIIATVYSEKVVLDIESDIDVHIAREC